jgi:hypothetical protein
MNDETDKDEAQTGTPAQKPGNNPRQHRLKLALRENLKRRKSQARQRGDVTMAPSNGDDGSPHDGSGKKPGR